MKILHIIPHLKRGGAERLVIEIVKELATRNNTVVNLVILHNIINYDISEIKHLINYIPANVNLSIWKKNKIEVSGLQNFIEIFQPDVIHSHLFEAEIVSRSCYYPKARWYSHCHSNTEQLDNFSLGVFFSKEKLTNLYEKQYLIHNYKKNGGTIFIAISKKTLDYFKNVLGTYPIFLLPNAIAYKRFAGLKKIKNEVLNLVTIGALDKNKNQKFLIEVSKILACQNCLFHLRIIGEGKLKLLLEREIAKYQLEKHVSLLGAIDKVEEILSKSDIYVHSAKSEAFGLTIIEAMASGLPVITLDGGGNRDIIIQGKNGYMIDRENPEEFAQKIMEVWSDNHMYKKMSDYAMNYARKFDIVPYVDLLLNIYHDTKTESVLPC